MGETGNKNKINIKNEKKNHELNRTNQSNQQFGPIGFNNVFILKITFHQNNKKGWCACMKQKKTMIFHNLRISYLKKKKKKERTIHIKKTNNKK